MWYCASRHPPHLRAPHLHLASAKGLGQPIIIWAVWESGKCCSITNCASRSSKFHSQLYYYRHTRPASSHGQPIAPIAAISRRLATVANPDSDPGRACESASSLPKAQYHWPRASCAHDQRTPVSHIGLARPGTRHKGSRGSLPVTRYPSPGLSPRPDYLDGSYLSLSGPSPTPSHIFPQLHISKTTTHNGLALGIDGLVRQGT